VSDVAAYSGLFLAALVAATLLPAQSEIVLGGMLLAGYDPGLLFLVATIGNVLGAVVNWLLGRFIEHFRHRRWFPVSDRDYRRAEAWYQRFGVWTLLLAWAPFIGDPLTVIAGALRVNIGRFLLLVTIGKAARYALLILVLRPA
jgi:membrane protein YqaA with SNARE-associated domain